MRTRFCAMMRKPAFSISAFTAPVRFRWVASGLMIEKVRSTAIGQSVLIVVERRCRSRRLITAAWCSGKAERPLTGGDTLYHEPKGLRARLPDRMEQSKATRKNTPEENIMIRKSMLALAAIATVGAAALAPTSASAWGFRHHHGWGHGLGFGFYGPGYVSYAPDCYLVKRINRFGEVRLVRVCS